MSALGKYKVSPTLNVQMLAKRDLSTHFQTQMDLLTDQSEV